MGCGDSSKTSTPTDTPQPDTTVTDTTDPDISEPDIVDPDTQVEDTTPDGPTCAAYCAATQEACTGDNAQYSSEADCLDYCSSVAAFEMGTDDDTTGNTIGCRTYHAGVAAAADPEIHCAHAGPTGGDACGTWCENYCHLAMTNCADDNALYADGAACATACDAFRTDGVVGDATGDTVQCRLYHLGTPAAGDPVTHCGHGGEIPTDFCVDPCEPQCDGKVCGDDGCGADCGTCGDGEVCDAGACCTPACTNEDGSAKACGDDGCGGVCGTCTEAEVCDAGACCAPACTNEDGSAKACGDDSCGGVCGTCAETEVCTAESACCTPTCVDEMGTAKACGDDSCGGSCGDCAEGEGCDESGQCYVLCVPNCTNGDGTTKACGDDGCSGSCGDCAVDESCTNAGQCVIPGPMCSAVAALNCGDSLTGLSNDMAGSTNELSHSDFECSPSFSGTYTNSELAYSINVPTDQIVTVDISESYSMDGMVLVDEGLGCAPSATNCIDGSFSKLEWNATAGTDYYVVLEHFNGSTDTFNLDVTCCTPDCSADPCGDNGCGGTCDACSDGQLCYQDVCCVPDCTGKICGGDGCGGSCGDCPAGELCSDVQDACAAPTGGDTCADALEISALPFSDDGDSSVYANDLEFGDSQCPGEAYGKGGASMDVVYTFTAPATGGYNINLDSTFDAALYVVTDCADIANTCVGAEENVGSNNTEEMLVSLEAGITYLIIVDGYSSFSDNSGPYTLTVDLCTPACTATDGSAMVCGDDQCGGVCGTCAATDVCNDMGQCEAAMVGDNCGNPHVVDAFPFTYDGDTSAASNTMSYGDGVCDGETYGEGESANDNVFMYEAMSDTSLTVSLTPNTGFDSALYVVTDCGDVTNTCVGADEGIGAEEISFPAVSGTTYYIVVDGYNTNAGQYTLDVTECETTCDTSGATCGDDGCGGTCGECAVDEACSSGQCIMVGPGDTCDDPILVDAVPFTHAGDTTLKENDYDYGSGVCAGDTSSAGGGSNDDVFAFAPDMDGSYTISLDNDYDGAVYVVTDCTDVDTSCVAGAEAVGSSSPEVILTPLTSGTTYYIIVDGWSNFSNSSGTYTLNIDVCVPTCDTTGAVCGDDGCGGTCGECVGVDENCLNGQCVGPDAPGDTCDNPVLVNDMPFSYTGDTSLASTNDSYEYGDGACEGETYGSGDSQKDNAILFIPAASGPYTITLDADFDSALYLVTDCADVDGSCIGAHETSGEEELLVSLDGGTNYYIIVDGYGSSFSTYEGTYTLTIDTCITTCVSDGAVCGDDGCGGTCGDCGANENCIAGLCEAQGPGDTCDDPIMVDGMPFTHSGDTSFSNNDYGYSTCPGGGGTSFGGNGSNDDAYSFTPTETAEYTISFAGFDGNLYITTDCSDIDNTCLAGSETFGQSEEIVTTLDAGTTYFIIVDGWANTINSGSGPYTLTITQAGGCVPTCTSTGAECGDDGCGGSCGDCNAGEDCTAGQCIGGTSASGDTCDDAIAIDAFPYNYSGTTIGSVDNYNADGSANCDTFWGDGSGVADVAFTITPADTGSYEFTMTVASGGAPSYLILTTDCGSLPTSCEQAEDVWGGGTMTANLAGGTTYFLIVTGGDSSEAGAFTLDVVAPAACTPDCTDGAGGTKVCGDDGCGGSCGDCGANETCNAAGQCEVDLGMVGDTCANPYVISAFPYAHSGDTTAMANDYDGGTTCADDSWGDNGSGGVDSVYTFTAPSTGEYTISLTCTQADSFGGVGCGPTLMYLASDCADIESTCVGDSNDMYGTSGGTIAATLDAGTSYYLIVDGLYSFDSGSYDLTIDAPEEQVAGLDISGWVLKGEKSGSTTMTQFTFPTGTMLADGGVVVIGRNADQAAFEGHWGALPAEATYFSGSNDTPIVNGTYVYTLLDSSGMVMDGPTIAADTGSLTRVSPDEDAGLAASWVAGDEAAATPGSASAAGAESGSFYISEMTDASGSGNFKFEFIELHLTGAEEEAEAVDVQISGMAFVPADITVAVGTTVVWTNGDNMGHTVTSADASNNIVAGGELDSPTLNQGDTYEHTFATAGVYPYRCTPHGSMTGTVTVQ